MPNERILVVDDKLTVCKRCANVLEAHGYRVTTAGSGKQAVEVERAQPVDLMLISLNLPDISGLEVFHLTRQSHQDLVGVALTTRGAVKNIIAAFEMGFADFISKPLNDVHLVQVIEGALTQRRLLQEVTRLKALHSVYEASRAILSESHRDPLCELLAKIGRQETASDTASLMLLDPSTKELRLVAASGLDPALIDHATRRLGEPVAGIVAERGEMVLLQENNAAFAQMRPHLSRPQVSASLCAPLSVGDHVLGVLNLSKHTPGAAYTESDMELAAVLCGEGALALSRVLADEERQRNQRIVTVGTMLTGIIHDFRSPLTAIRGMVGLLELQKPELKEQCNFIVHEIARAVEMMEGVLNYTQGDTNMKIEPCSLEEFMQDISTATRRELEGLTINIVEDYGYRGNVPMDKRRMRRALLNLVHNSRNAMGSGATLTLRTYAANGNPDCPEEVVVEVEDTGDGMTDEVQRRLFEPFFTKGSHHGTGLGMCIVKSVVDAHQGAIRVRSAVGRGTTMSIRLKTHPTVA